MLFMSTREKAVTVGQRDRGMFQRVRLMPGRFASFVLCLKLDHQRVPNDQVGRLCACDNEPRCTSSLEIGKFSRLNLCSLNPWAAAYSEAWRTYGTYLL